MTKAEFKKPFFRDLKKSLILKPEDYKFWLINYDSLPSSAIKFFHQKVKQANRTVDICIEAGLESRPEQLEKINLATQKIKKIYFQAKEAEEVSADESSSILSKLDEI